MKHFAVEVLRLETRHRVAEAVLRASAKLGYTYDRIESLDRFKVGTVEFQRFRVVVDDVLPLLEALFTGGRAVISPDCTVRLKSRTGKTSFSILTAVPREQLVFRGPGAQYWERQFTTEN